MRRQELRLIGLGGCGGKLVDTIATVDERFQPFFINSSKTDVEALSHYDDLDKNYIITSLQNGTGRKREMGKRLVQKKIWNIIETLQLFEEDVLYFVTSFGGGSGSSTLSTLLQFIDVQKKENGFDKIINIIGVLPSLDSKDIILTNTLETWDEVMNYECVNNMIFIDNNNLYQGQQLSEDEINENFAILFDSIFEIPMVDTGTNFDNGNLKNVLIDKGCMYIYSLPNNCTNIQEAYKQAQVQSVLAKIYKNKKNTIIDDEDDGKEKMQCGYIGTSLNNLNYKHTDILSLYKPLQEDYQGYNDENNLLLISGALPPFYSIQVIEVEIRDRQRNNKKISNNNFSDFTIDFSSTIQDKEISQNIPSKQTKSKKPNMKKVMKQNLSDIFK
jgi:cell division GTPase FtsZ